MSVSDRSSPVNGGYEAASLEPAMRLTVRKDLFPEECLSDVTPVISSGEMLQEGVEGVSCVKLATDFEQSIDDIANQKLQVHNGALPSQTRTRHRKHKQHSRRDAEHSPINGCLSTPKKKKKKSLREYYQRTAKTNSIVPSQVKKGGKNLYLVSSSECQNEAGDDEEESNKSESSEDEVLKCSVKLPIINLQRQSGKPYSHELSQLSTKKSKSKESSKKRTHVVMPCSGKPRSMLGICSSRSKKKSKKLDYTATYQSQIVDTNTNIKLKIRRTSAHDMVTPTPISVADIGQRKSKKKRSATPEVSESSGEEYDPSRGDTSAAMSVAAPKPRQPRPKTRKVNSNKSKSEKTDKSRVSGDGKKKDTGPQSPWAHSMPEEILFKIFDYVVSSQGTLPTVIRLSGVCKLWHSVSCRPELWRNVDLAQYTSEKNRTDFKLVWLLENRLTLCQTLNIAQWKVCNVSWVLACVINYCPELVELSVAGWSRITPEQLYDLVQGLPKLQRLDLSLTSETGGSSTCLSATSIARVAENFGERLTHLTLANNKFTALPQILSSVASHCPNLEVLDISGAMATTHPAAVPLEALQKGCPKMRVFRAANSQLVLASATTSQQMEVEGWTCLEELSIAGEPGAERVGVGEYRLGDEALGRLVRGATRLRLLDLRGLQRLTDSGIVRVPAWDLQHLFLGGSNIIRKSSACLELICEKWSHSLLELDLSWASATRVLNDAVATLADSPHSKLRILNLCGSAVFLEQVKKVLLKCPHLESLNLSSCRALPRGMKRLFTGKELQDLKDSLDPEKAKPKEDSDDDDESTSVNITKKEADSKSGNTPKASPKNNISDNTGAKVKGKSSEKSSPCVFQEPKSVSDTSATPESQGSQSSIITKTVESTKDISETVTSLANNKSSRTPTSNLSSPLAQSKPDSSSTPRSESVKNDLGSPHFSPVRKPDSQVPNSPDVLPELAKSNNSWNLGQFKTTPTHKSEASPLNRLENHNTSKLKHSKIVEQCSPTTSLENKPSPETHCLKPDIKNPSSWNYSGGYSPMTRQDQFSSQRSPYSAQPSPAQPSPYSTQPSPYSTQPSPYSSQPSPYSAQPSPDTSQMVKPDIQKASAWNTGNFSPMPKQHTPFSPHPSTHPSPDPGLGVKSDAFRNNCSKTPGQYSPMSRQDRLHHSPYSPRPSVENVYSNKKSPGVGKYSPMMRPDCHLPSPDGGHTSRPIVSGRTQDIYGRSVSKMSEMVQNIPPPEVPNSWGFSQVNNTSTSGIESLVWGGSSFNTEPTLPPRVDNIPSMLNTPSPQTWNDLPPFDSAIRRPNELSDPWTLGEFRVEPPQQAHNSFVDQNVNFDALSAHIGQSHVLQSYLDDSYSEASRVD